MGTTVTDHVQAGYNSWLSIDVSLGADPYGVIIIREFDEA